MNEQFRQFVDAIARTCDVHVREEGSDDINCRLSTAQFEAKMLREKDGLLLLQRLEDGEWKQIEQLGLCHAEVRGGLVEFHIPRWLELLRHMRAYDVKTIQEQRCKEKTSKGNVYKDEYDARCAAHQMSGTKHAEIVPFLCTSCQLWHIGRKNK